MANAPTTTAVLVPKTFTDVLYLASQRHIPPEIRQLLRQKKLSYFLLTIDKFPQVLHRLDLVGTVIIDAEGLDISQQQKLAQIIESLEAKDIGTILINNRVKAPVKSFSLAGPQVKSFSLANTIDSVSTEELWVKINVNLAFRTKGSQVSIKSAVQPRHAYRTYHNTLAEQLRMTGALVDTLSEQLRMAGLVQRDFLPTQLPSTDRIRWATAFLPAEWVSGDIYDVVRIDDRYIGFYVADAVGHGVPAALLTIFLKQTLTMRETIETKHRVFTPAEVMQNLNKRMAAQKLSGYQFATCCYCLLDTKTLKLTCARAGHPYPILIRPNHKPRQLEIRGSLLGIFDQAEYTDLSIELAPGDKFLLYSDGTEALIGAFDETTGSTGSRQAGFKFTKEFQEIKELSVVEMMEKFTLLAQHQEVDPAEVDDITAVALEVL